MFGRKKIEDLNAKLLEKTEENGRLTVQLMKKHQEEMPRQNFIHSIREDIPEEQNARKAYFADITMFYNKIFKKKLAQMISKQKDSLAMAGLSQQDYDFFRATINALYLVDNWCSYSEREHLSYLQEARQRVDTGSEVVDTISKKYNTN